MGTRRVIEHVQERVAGLAQIRSEERLDGIRADAIVRRVELLPGDFGTIGGVELIECFDGVGLHAGVGIVDGVAENALRGRAGQFRQQEDCRATHDRVGVSCVPRPDEDYSGDLRFFSDYLH